MTGEFVWHSHPDADETFILLRGDLGFHFRNGERRLLPGDLISVPRGVEHQPWSSSEAWVLVVEPSDVVNTGDQPVSDLTRSQLRRYQT